MNATAIAGQLNETSPKSKARLAGGLLLITVVAGGFAQGFLAGSLIVSGDAAATATNILAHQSLSRRITGGKTHPHLLGRGAVTHCT